MRSSPIRSTFDVVPSPVMSSCAVAALAMSEAVGCWICCFQAIAIEGRLCELWEKRRAGEEKRRGGKRERRRERGEEREKKRERRRERGREKREEKREREGKGWLV